MVDDIEDVKPYSARSGAQMTENKGSVLLFRFLGEASRGARVHRVLNHMKNS